MRVSEAFPSKYLRVEDLDDHDLTVTIKSVAMEELGQGTDKQTKLIVYFLEVDKGLACNKTNAGIIAKLWGDETSDWKGKRITLWPNHDVQFKGEIVSAIRVRSKAPTAHDGVRTTLTWAEAVDLCTGHGISVDDLKYHLKEKGFTSWNAQGCTPFVRALVAAEPPPQQTDANEDVEF